MTTDLDALIAEARAGVQKYRGYAEEPLFRKLADALESTLAELRQERERADDLKILAAGRVEAWRLTEANKALSRAEETIEAVEDLVTRHYLDTSMGKKVFAILTEFYKQKEQA